MCDRPVAVIAHIASSMLVPATAANFRRHCLSAVESQHNRLHIQHVRTAGVRTGIFITSAKELAYTPAIVCLHSCIVPSILTMHYHELHGKRGVQEETIYLREQSFVFLHHFFSSARGAQQRVPAEYRCNRHRSFCASAVCSDLCDEQMPSSRRGT